MCLFTSKKKFTWPSPLGFANEKTPSQIIPFHYLLSLIPFYLLHSTHSSQFVITLFVLHQLHRAQSLPIFYYYYYFLLLAQASTLNGKMKSLNKYLLNE